MNMRIMHCPDLPHAKGGCLLLFRAALLAWVALIVSACTTQTVLYEKASPYNTIIVTQSASGLRTLLFKMDGGRQSVVKPGDPDHLELPYTRAMLVGLALCEEPRRILIVGLGGGTLPMFLRKNYPDATIDVVDIDPGIAYAAREFFGFREDDQMRVRLADGRQFIENSRQPYDAIFLDAFGGDTVPPHLTTQEFLQAVRRAVKPDGVVIGNIWRRNFNPLYDSMVRTYQEVFDDLFILEVHGDVNMIMLALPRSQPLGRDELMQLARKISAAGKFRFDLGDPASFGFLHAQDKNRGVRVLRDAELGQPKPNY